MGISDQQDFLDTQELESEAQVFNDYLFVQPPENAAGSILGAMLDPSNFEKAQPVGLSEEIAELGNVGAFIFVKHHNGPFLYHMTNRFYLQTMDISSKERAQINNTFGASSVFLFGESVKIYSFSGVAVDYDQNDFQGKLFHGTALLDLYNKQLRGTNLVDNDRIAVLKVLNHTIWGYPLNFSYRKSANREKTIEFAMSWIVTDHVLTASSVVTNKDLEDHSAVHTYLQKLGEIAAELITNASEILGLIYGIQTNIDKIMSKRQTVSAGDLNDLKSQVKSDFVEPLKSKLTGYEGTDAPTEIKLVKNGIITDFEKYFSELNVHIDSIKAGEDDKVWYDQEEWNKLTQYYNFVFTQKQKLMGGGKV